MDSEIVDAVTEWESAPFSGGYEGLHGLADREFSGAVTQGTVWAFMLNGRLIGVEDGSVSSFDEADGTVYEAPADALPLLYAMQGHGEKQAQYYTNEKPISEADATLSSGSFTGYIELSENVLSGDYYTVYYGGKSMSVAFVGNSRQLLTDEEAFERADDEVGIYTVYAADLEVIDIPEPAGAADEESPGSAARSTDQPDSETDADTADTTETADSVTPTPSPSETSSAPPNSATSSSETASTETTDTEGKRPTATKTAAAAETNGGPSVAQSTSAASASAASTAEADGEQNDDAFSAEAEWRNAKTIPSLDPSSDPDEKTASRSAAQRSASKSPQGQSTAGKKLSRKQLRQRLKRAEKVMEKAEAQHEQLVKERDSAVAERDAAREELESVREQLSEAEAEVDRLEAQLESGPTADVSGMSGGRSMSTTEALEGTNLLVRYASKGDATLEDALSGAATQEEVRGNLRIDSHTTFDSNGVSVDGTPFETFLDDRIELAFTRWLVEEFLFDIQQTGNQTDLKGIYEAIPAINRAEIRGSVSLDTDDEESIDAEFDLVVRDKRDQPLFVADFNESNQPVGGAVVNSLVRDGSEIIQHEESFAGAFAVTTSYYKGEALDAAADATGGGLLSASRGKSFVYISRKQGFHLCLIERLGDTFDLHVPEL
ncbi:DUF7527 domain-containing protein [Halohasta litorea]|uniref:DUF7527 domain-containing protein n=1 Tax=Halohasta litorea TaxID=869891 RepID=A0ABD6D775_9EURY|nr:hypothetical protein [Halohasta litorea]